MPCQHEKHGAPRVQAVGGVAKHVGVCAPCHCEQSVARDRGRPGVGPEQSPGGIARSGVLSEEARPARQGLNVHLDGVGLAADAADEVLEGEVVGDPSLDRDDLVHVDPAVSAGAGGAQVPDIVADGRVAAQLQLARGPIGVTESLDSGLGRRVVVAAGEDAIAPVRVAEQRGRTVHTGRVLDGVDRTEGGEATKSEERGLHLHCR